VNANANYNSLSAHLGSGLKKFVFLTESTTLIPSFRADYTTVQSKGYTENGAGALNLTVNSQSYNMLVTSADLRLDHMLSDKLKLSVNAGAGYNLLNNQVQATSAFAGGGPVFTTYGLQTSPWTFNGGLGMSGRVSKDVDVNVRYDTQFTNSGYNNQMVSGKVRISF
jgi:outer membrane autotransporter protein